MLERLTPGEMETLLRRLAGDEPGSPAAETARTVNREFDDARFRALKED